MLELADNADAKGGARLFARGLTQKFYVDGLNQDLQRLVTAQLSELGDSKALHRKCVELEASQSQNKKATVGELSTREEDIMKELNALRSRVVNAEKGSGNNSNYAKAAKTPASNANKNKGAKPKSTKPFTVDAERVAK